MDNIVGENIRRHRTAKPWTQEQLAGAAQIDARTVQRAEAGKPISVESLQAIAGALDVPVEGLRVNAAEEAVKKAVADVKAKYIEVPLAPVERGKDLSNLISGSHALYFDLFDATSDEHEDAAAAFKESITDWIDLYSELSPTQQRDCDKSLQSEIDSLRSMGFAITAGTKQVSLKMSDGGRPTIWRVMVVFVARAEAPRLFALIDKKAAF